MKYELMKRFMEMAKRMGKSLNEVFAVVPNSFQQYAAQVSAALREDPPEDFNRDDWGYVEALIGDEPTQVLIECYKSDKGWTYFLYDVAFEDGSIKWSNGKEVEVEAALKIKPAMERRMSETVDPPEEAFVDVSDAKFVFDSTDGDKQFASVEIAQRADVKNRNNRIYPKEVLRDAVERLNTRIKNFGPMPMETMHRDEHCLGDVWAVIHEVAFNESTGVVTLPKIEVLDTSSGRDIMTLLNAGLAIQVSQRGVGFSHEEIDPVSGLLVQKMDWLQIDGWDSVWNGDASVSEAAFALNESALENVSDAGSQESGQQEQQEDQQQQQERQQQVQSRRQARFFSGPRANEGNLGQEQQVDSSEREQDEQQQVIGKEILSLVQTSIQQALTPLQNQLVNETQELRQKEFVRIADEVIDDVLAQHPRFSPKQKEAIKSGVNLTTMYAQVESLDVSSISRVLTPLIEREIEQADKIVANDQLSGMGLPRGNSGSLYINRAGGVTYSEVVNDAHISRFFDGQSYEHLVEATIDHVVRGNRMTPQNPDGNWVMPVDHYGMKALAGVMDNFFKGKGAQAVTETTASDIGIPVNMVSMLLVPVVWRMITAFRIAQLHPMTLLVEDIPIERWAGQQHDVNDYERWNALDPGDNQPIPESTLSYDEYRLACGYQPQHVRVTPRARATTRNTVMNPAVRATALMAREIVNQNDLIIWRGLIMELMKYGQ